MSLKQLVRLTTALLFGVWVTFTSSCAQAGYSDQQAATKGLTVNVHDLPGKIVYFTMERTKGGLGGNDSLYVVNADGTGQRKLLDDVGYASPKWLNGGEQILIEKYEQDNNPNLAFKIFDLPTGKLLYALPRNMPVKLTVGNAKVSFSPDRKKVAVRAGRLCIVDLSGKDAPVCVEGGPIYQQPQWSPDGNKIAFSGCLDEWCNEFEIFTVDSDGSGVRQLTHIPSGELDEENRRKFLPTPWTPKQSLTAEGKLKYRQKSSSPRWAPDSKRIVFDGWEGIYTMNADGSDLRQILKDPACRYPVWSPDGTKIMYVCLRGGGGTKLPLGGILNYKSPVSNIYVCNADGTGEAQVTHNTYPANDDRAPLNVTIQGFDWGP